MTSNLGSAVPGSGPLVLFVPDLALVSAPDFMPYFRLGSMPGSLDTKQIIIVQIAENQLFTKG